MALGMVTNASPTSDFSFIGFRFGCIKVTESEIYQLEGDLTIKFIVDRKKCLWTVFSQDRHR